MAQAITTLRCVFTVGGVEIPELAAALVELDVATKENEPARCTACFTALPGGGDVLDRQILDFGGWIKVSRGGTRLFSGRIVALGLRCPATAPPILQVVAEDALLGLSGVRRTRTFTDVSDTDILYRIASDHGLQADVELSGPTMKTVAQVATTDLDFLVERMQRLDARVWVEDSTLYVRHRRLQPRCRGLRCAEQLDFVVEQHLYHWLAGGHVLQRDQWVGLGLVLRSRQCGCQCQRSGFHFGAGQRRHRCSRSGHLHRPKARHDDRHHGTFGSDWPGVFGRQQQRRDD